MKGGKPILAITMGDAAGIGPEICLKALNSGKISGCLPFIIGSINILEKARSFLRIKTKLVPVSEFDKIKFTDREIQVLQSGHKEEKIFSPGKVNPAYGRASIEYLRTAAELARQGKIDAITTCPINKESLLLANLNYEGHTEFLKQYFRGKVTMFFVAGRLRIALVTRHIRLIDVPRAITQRKILETMKIIYNHKYLFGMKEPTFAVLSVNPHAGEWKNCSEEKTKIIPAIEKARASGIDSSGPYPPDAFYGSGKYKDFDVTIAMYHDQALIPYKMLAFGKGVNVTLGLPIIRTSVDHGTAYDIAWRGRASEKGLIQAIKLASSMARKMRKHTNSGGDFYAKDIDS